MISEDHLDPDKHLWPAEPPKAYQTVLDFFNADTEAEAIRHCYKYTDCGAWLSFTESGIELGSIVEGCDFGTAIYPLHYADNFIDSDIQARINAIEAEASALWDWCNEPRDVLGRRHRHGMTNAERGLDAPDISADFARLNPEGRSS